MSNNPIAIDGAFALYEKDIRAYKNRSLKSKFNLKEVVMPWIKSFIWAALFSLALLGWMAAADKPTCVFNYHNGITTCN